MKEEQGVKNVLITGASRGIGRATAIAFAHAGYRVCINYHMHRAEAEELAAYLRADGAAAEVLQADVADAVAVREMVAQAGEVDVLVNNAGIAGQRLFTDVTEDEWQRMLAVNLTGLFHCAQAVLPGMIHRKKGKIIALSSIWGITGGSCEVAYSAAKAGVIGLVRSLAKEVGPSNIQVNCVAPGVIDTDMNRVLSVADRAALCEETPLMRMGTPEDVARSILFFAGPGGDFITGQVLSPNGGFVI
ncbi:MAG: 3-oxoacyl-ACP reductase FabG [Ethanoligenens sp.]